MAKLDFHSAGKMVGLGDTICGVPRRTALWWNYSTLPVVGRRPPFGEFFYTDLVVETAYKDVSKI